MNASLLLISTALSLEAASLVYYSVNYGGLFYADSKSATITIGDKNPNATDNFNTRFGLPRLRIHPLFGWASARGEGYNKEGFYSPVEYPVPALFETFVIGVFGESVAFNFWNWNNSNNFLAPYLKRNVPDLKNREIVVLNFSKEGFRTPQNLNTLVYFLLSDQKFDLVLNIGGFNEVTGTWKNYKQGINPAFPTIDLLYALSTLTRADRLSRETIILYRGKYMQADAMSCTFALCWMFFRTYGEHLESSSRVEEAMTNTYDQNRNVLFLPIGSAPVNITPYENFFADFWTRSVRFMHALSQASGAQYLHIIQPNQYIETDRIYSESERAIAILSGFSDLKILRKGYRIMLRKAKVLKEMKINIASAIHIFDDVEEPVYRDNCCHFNQAGESIFAKFISREIAIILNDRDSNNFGLQK